MTGPKGWYRNRDRAHRGGCRYVTIDSTVWMWANDCDENGVGMSPEMIREIDADPVAVDFCRLCVPEVANAGSA